MQNNGHYAVQGHLKSPLGTNRKPVCDFLLVNHIRPNLHSISHRLRCIAEYWSIFWCRQGVPLFNALVGGGVGGKPLNLGLQNSASRNWRHLETVYFDILNRLNVTCECDRETDGQTSCPAKKA